MAQVAAVDNDVELEDRQICSECIGDAFLKAEINSQGDPGRCFYCQEEGQTIGLPDLASQVEVVFEQHYRRTSDQMSGYDYAMQSEGLGDWERPGDPVVEVIAWTVEVEEQPAIDLQILLETRHSDREMDQMGEETEFADTAYYASKRVNDIDFQLEWTAFEEGLKTRGRFFNRAAEERLLDLFGKVHTLKTEDGRSVIRVIGPGTDIPSLHRARVFQSEAKLQEALAAPERLVGSPASQYASAGRMNAKGVSVFYGATDPELTLAETRPPVGSRAILGRFDLLAPLKVLDVEALEKVLEEGSLFDPGFIRRLERAKFLASLAARIRMPVMPDDEGVDYLATQAMAEYLADRVAPRVDGILYGSAQGHEGAHNVALFNHAAHVAPHPPPLGATYNVWTARSDEDGLQPDYTVWEELNPEAVAKAKAALERGRDPISRALDRDPIAPIHDDDGREPMLRLDRASLEVRHVRRMSIDAPAYKVDFRKSPVRGDAPFFTGLKLDR